VDIICSKYIMNKMKQNLLTKYSHWKNMNLSL
jgi:hypothetical protein